MREEMKGKDEWSKHAHRRLAADLLRVCGVRGFGAALVVSQPGEFHIGQLHLLAQQSACLRGAPLLGIFLLVRELPQRLVVLSYI